MSDPYNTAGMNNAPRAHTGLDHASITTAFELPSCRIVRNLGVVRGITVRSRSVVGSFLGGLQSLFGGNITIYTELCEQARRETYSDMIAHARQMCERDHWHAL
jgi:uncharacterized protein YbjQ (UPF0145 family)